MEFWGIQWIGVTSAIGHKVLVTIIYVAAVVVVRFVVRAIVRAILDPQNNPRPLFWTRQGISIVVAVALIAGLLSIWFDDPTRLSTAAGLFSAGLAVALQKVITSLAGYFAILRGNNFTVGDRIVMGGVRGDVIALGFIQTKIMEMGEPPAEQPDSPAMWVRSRQFTGRIVTVANSRIFDEPIYNYTRDFPFIWEELLLPVSYDDDAAVVERVLLDAARKHTRQFLDISAEASEALRRRYFVDVKDFEPRVFWRITDNWLELSVRFVVREHGVREVKDAISRDVMAALKQAGIGIASATYDVVGFPPLRIESMPGVGPRESSPRAPDR